MMRPNLRLLSALCVLEGLGALLWEISIPFGGSLSPTRIGILSVILLVSLGWLFAYFQTGPVYQAGQFLQGRRGRSILAGALICFPLLVLSSAAQRDVRFIYLEDAEFIRLLPILIWGSLLCIQIGLMLIFSDAEAENLQSSLQSLWKPTALLLAIFVAIWIFIAATKIGITPDVVGLSWGPPGTPITFAQIALVFAISMCFLGPLWLAFSGNERRFAKLDRVAFAVLWGLAVLLWWREPMIRSYFATPPMQPNFEYYPNSDAAVFDRSSYQLLYNTSFNTQLVRRPLYIGMLALDHAIAGPGYNETIFLQILVFAFIPPVIYLLTSKLSNRLAGLLAGGLIVLREANAIHLSGEIPAAHAKLMMSDLMTFLGVVLVMYLAVILVKKRQQNPWLYAVLGASLGLTTLVRTQSLVLLVPLLLFITLGAGPLKARLVEALIVVLGLGVVLLPWLGRNWSLTGTILFDDRGEQRLLARDYSADPTLPMPNRLPDESENDFTARLQRGILGFASAHPIDVLFFVSNHFFHNLADSVLFITPLYASGPPESLITRVPYWDAGGDNFTVQEGAALALNLVFLALGIAIVQRTHGLAGWLPLAAFIFYSAGNALARTSGWRFILPVDWIVLMYVGIGLAYLPSGLERLKQKQPGQNPPSSTKSQARLLPALFAALFLVGAAVPIAERRANADFEPASQAARAFLDENRILASGELDAFMQQENATLVSGIALYPRYFQLKERIRLTDMPEDFPYLHFWLISRGSQQIVLPLRNVPSGIPHTATVTVIGCKETAYISAWVVIIDSPEEHILMSDPSSLLNCSLNSSN